VAGGGRTGMRTSHKIIIGDSRWMKELPDRSVHLVVTSPPYWQLKDYGNEGQIGFNDSYEDYINNLNLVWSECHRVLHDGCRLCVNIGDQFARSVYYGRYKIIPIRTEIIKFCESAGYDYMGAVIWQKVTTCNTTGGATIMGSFPFPRNGILKLDYEFILIFKKYGVSPKVTEDFKEQSKMSTEEWNQYFAGHWNFPGEKQDRHLAMFPEELPRRLIRMFSFVGDTVVDPFLGSGTTSLVAKKLNRNSVGYEINKDYVPMIISKVGGDQRELFRDCRIEVVSADRREAGYAERVNALPYKFTDPVRFDKKVDPRKIRFGSKIDGSETGRESFFTVADVVSPETLTLSNGVSIRLIGIKEDPGTRVEAMRFLREKTDGQKVYLKYDALKYDDERRLMCYLYLSNKTFINAHLIKSGLVDVETGYDFRYLAKFLSGKEAV
jgi:site-specific DNA-methyltransferase (adenine-specific)